jgi:hypothetical protein
MALTGNLSADRAAVKYDFPTAYARISVVSADKLEFRIIVDFYSTKAAREANAMPVLGWNYVTAPLDGDLLPACYAYLKTLPDFAGWVDA